VEWVDSDGTNLTKTPLTNSTEAVDGSPANDYFFPITYTATTLVNPVVYFMCQATGYKLNSNKELPSPS
jgi:hypothetical protein